MRKAVGLMMAFLGVMCLGLWRSAGMTASLHGQSFSIDNLGQAYATDDIAGLVGIDALLRIW